MREPDFADFLRAVLVDGQMIYRAGPESKPAEDARALSVLRSAFADYRLALAGPLIDLDASTALAAARFLERAGWFLLSFAENSAQMSQALQFPQVPASAAQHLSADLLLRHVPALLRRAHVLGGGDPLAAVLVDVLRRWPLSGVLADLTEEPSTSLDFAGHPGLQLLYAERLVEHFKAGWVPPQRDYVELAWIEAGRDPRLLLGEGEPTAR